MDTMGPKISRSLFWLVLVFPLLGDTAAGASATGRSTNWFYRWSVGGEEGAAPTGPDVS